MSVMSDIPEKNESTRKRIFGLMDRLKKLERSTKSSDLVETEPKIDEQVEIVQESEKVEKSTEPVIDAPSEHIQNEIKTDAVTKSLLEPISESFSESKSDSRMSFDQFVDERMLISRDLFGAKEMKIKVLEVSDENPPHRWKLGDRVKLNKILITIKHLDTQEVEEGEFDIEAIEKELAEKRHYTSTNRWVPVNEIKNGYVVASRHTSLVSDAIALDYIVF